jgi:hypothetical protein
MVGLYGRNLYCIARCGRYLLIEGSLIVSKSKSKPLEVLDEINKEQKTKSMFLLTSTSHIYEPWLPLAKMKVQRHQVTNNKTIRQTTARLSF